MAVVEQLLRTEADGTLSFGNYELPEKSKLDNFEHQGNILKVKTFKESMSINRELMLMKVKYNKENRRDIMENCEIMNAQIVDMSKNLMVIQICDTSERIELFIEMLKSVSIVEIARTGTVALTKCKEQ